MIYSAILYKSADTDFDVVICVPQSPSDKERGPFLEGEGLTAEGKTLVAEFCNVIGVSFPSKN